MQLQVDFIYTFEGQNGYRQSDVWADSQFAVQGIKRQNNTNRNINGKIFTWVFINDEK